MDIKALLKDSWNEFSDQFFQLLMVTSPYIALTVFLSMLSAVGVVIESGLIWPIFVLSFIIQAMIFLAGLKYLYKQRGVQLALTTSVLINYVISMVVVGFAALCGLLLLVLPGLIVISLSFISPIYLLKEQQGPIEAISSSVSLLKQHLAKVTVLVIGLSIVFGLIDYSTTKLFNIVGIPDVFIFGVTSVLSCVLWLFSLPIMIRLYSILTSEHNQEFNGTPQ